MAVATRDSEARAETVALLALLRAAPKGVTWGDIAATVRLEGSAVEVFDKLGGEQGSLFADPKLVQARTTAEAELTRWHEDGLDLVTVLSGRYPQQLAAVFDCPPFLFYEGYLDPDDRGISVVGSRNASAAGVAMARDAARLLAERQISVVAGLAEGIDSAAHQEALSLGARTVAVIGTGITKHYPKTNKNLREAIAKSGLVLSQFYPEQPPTKNTFPMRNGTMSGYGLATIVVEAGEKSGSRIQARKAAHHGRPVILSRKVVTDTTWGKEMAKDPWVTVVSSRDELAAAVDQVLTDDNPSLLSELGLQLA